MGVEEKMNSNSEGAKGILYKVVFIYVYERMDGVFRNALQYGIIYIPTGKAIGFSGS